MSSEAYRRADARGPDASRAEPCRRCAGRADRVQRSPQRNCRTLIAATGTASARNVRWPSVTSRQVSPHENVFQR